MITGASALVHESIGSRNAIARAANNLVLSFASIRQWDAEESLRSRALFLSAIPTRITMTVAIEVMHQSMESK
jgi:translation initiation factor 2B subunit (eIF-2B alpha/beta/delta family)